MGENDLGKACSNEKRSSGFAIKIFAAVFGTILAPILVAVVVKVVEKQMSSAAKQSAPSAERVETQAPVEKSPNAAFQVGTVWNGTLKGFAQSLTVKGREGEDFQATVTAGGVIKDVKGKVKNDQVYWLLKDVVVVKGHGGADTFGTIRGDTIEFTSGTDTWTLRLRR